MPPAPTFGRRGASAVPMPAAYPAPRNAPAPAATETPYVTPDWAKWPTESRPPTSSPFGIIAHRLFSFEGRLQRRDYRLIRAAWYAVSLLIFYALARSTPQALSHGGASLIGVGLGYLVLGGLFVWTTLAMQVKRWHDRDKSWPWIFISFIPFAGPIWVVVELSFLEGTPGPNRFGPSPKAGDTAAVFE